MSTSSPCRSTRPTRASAPTASSPTSGARAAEALICLVGVQSNQFPRAVDLARQFIKAGLPVALGGFHVSGCISMLPVMPPEIQAAMDMGISMFAGEAEEGRLDEVLRDAWNGTLKPLYNYMDDLPSMEGSTSAPPSGGGDRAQRRAHLELRPRPRLPVPVLVLHHHQCAGPQEPLPHRRRSRSDHPRELRAGHHHVLHHRRQHGPQQALGRLLRPADRAQGERGHRIVPDHPGRHAVPSDQELHPQGALGWRVPRVHRAGEHQPGQPAGRQEAPEQDHRIPQDAAGVAHRRRLDLGRLYPGLPRRHPRTRSCATWRSSRRSCRSTSSSCSS